MRVTSEVREREKKKVNEKQKAEEESGVRRGEEEKA